MIRYLITNGRAAVDKRAWVSHLTRWIANGIEFIQIREREISAREMVELTREIVSAAHVSGTKVLVNDRSDVAIASGADGVHLRDNSPGPENFTRAGFLVTASCHGIEDLERCRGAQYILLSPVFPPISKVLSSKPLGLDELRRAAQISPAPLIALGGITRENAGSCVEAGAAGVGGISYFE